MRVVISGVAGLIGCHLAKYCLDRGYEVIGIDNFITGNPLNVKWLDGHRQFTCIVRDVTDKIDIDGPVDLVFNLACPASPVDFQCLSLEIMLTCSQGVRNMLELAKAKGAAFLQASSSEVYGNAEVQPQDEGYWGCVNPIGPRACYDEGKRYAEALTMAYQRRYGVPVRVTRIFNTYGPRMCTEDGRVVTNFICQALRGEPLTVHGSGSQTRSLCYVEDLVQGMARLAECDYCGPVNLGGEDEVSIRRLAEEVIELTDSASSIVEKPLPSDDPRNRRPDISLAKRILGWEPKTSRREGLKRTIEYYRNVLAGAVNASAKTKKPTGIADVAKNCQPTNQEV